MAKKSFTERRQAVRLDQLFAELRVHWQELPGKRNGVIHQSMGDAAMSTFALFALKYLSLLQFDTQTQVERDNLQQLFGIEQLCCGTYSTGSIRTILPISSVAVLMTSTGKLLSCSKSN